MKTNRAVGKALHLAERLGAVFEGTRPADREETARRRNPKLLRKRLQAMWR